MDPPGGARASRSRAFCVDRSIHNRGRIDIFDKKGNVVNWYARNHLKKAVANGSDANVEERCAQVVEPKLPAHVEQEAELGEGGDRGARVRRVECRLARRSPNARLARRCSNVCVARRQVLTEVGFHCRRPGRLVDHQRIMLDVFASQNARSRTDGYFQQGARQNNNCLLRSMFTFT